MLYRRLVDRRTRQIDLGATEVGGMCLPSYEPARPIMLLWIEGIPGDRLDGARLAEVRNLVQAELQRIASYADGSSALLALNRQITAYLTDRQRSLNVWHGSPPGFGQRRLEATWLEHLEVLDQETSGRRSLVWHDAWPRWRPRSSPGATSGVECSNGQDCWTCPLVPRPFPPRP
jgi:hypothetical protein